MVARGRADRNPSLDIVDSSRFRSDAAAGAPLQSIATLAIFQPSG
jgi:hypothetical protein